MQTPVLLVRGPNLSWARMTTFTVARRPGARLSCFWRRVMPGTGSCFDGPFGVADPFAPRAGVECDASASSGLGGEDEVAAGDAGSAVGDDGGRCGSEGRLEALLESAAV